MRPFPQAHPTSRTGHVYVDVPRRSLRFLNSAAEELHEEGVPFLAGELTAGTLRTLSGEIVTATDLPLYLAWRTGRPVEAQFLLTRPEGKVWHIAWTTSPIAGEDTRLAGVLGTIACGPYQPDPDRVAELSHDLRTPLQTLRLQSAVVEQLAQGNPELTASLAILRNSAERAVQLGLELLDCCRGPAPRGQTAAREWFPLGSLLKNLADEQAVAARAKGLELAADLGAAQGWEVHSNPMRLGRVVANLLANAVRYTPRGQIALRTAWREEKSERLLEIHVIDSGPGIGEEEHDSIFNAYERGKAAQSDSGGSGLGLAVVDRLVEELGLRVELESFSGHGSTFTLLVPGAMLRQAIPSEPEA
ncbi:MAG: HAMP domain-containing histidine kinase [Gemmataceae bacterium]|nr:HAMP domain-containing histidine kinase [Gemmataceae bacterium]